MKVQHPIHSKTIATVGFGEAAQAFVKGWQTEGYASVISAYDIKTDGPDPDVAKGKFADYEDCNVVGHDSLAHLLEHANTVFSLVTADQAKTVVLEAVKTLNPGTFFFDGNSCAPKTKQECAALIEEAGGHYVDMAIMAPVYPKLHQTPVLISSKQPDAALDILTGLGMAARIEPGPVGRASSIKMVRSIMVKGMEALMAETMLAGRRAGVEDIVLASLEKTYPGFGWRTRASYNLERMMVHGVRRAAEMREVVKTIDDLGLASDMAQATVGWQQVIGDLGLEAGTDDLEKRLDGILGTLGR